MTQAQAVKPTAEDTLLASVTFPWEETIRFWNPLVAPWFAWWRMYVGKPFVEQVLGRSVGTRDKTMYQFENDMASLATLFGCWMDPLYFMRHTVHDSVKQARLFWSEVGEMVRSAIGGESVGKKNDFVEEALWNERGTTLYRYRLSSTPLEASSKKIFFLPWQGISSPVLTKICFIDEILKRGYELYLLASEVGVGEYETVGLGDYFNHLIPRAVKTARGDSESIDMIGYCQGASLGTAYLSLNPEAPVRKYAHLCGPVDFANAGILSDKVRESLGGCFDTVLDLIGNPPTLVIRELFQQLPSSQKFSDMDIFEAMLQNIASGDYHAARVGKILFEWSHDVRSAPERFVKEWLHAFYEKNVLMKDEFSLCGKKGGVAAIRPNMLAVAAAKDEIAPPDSVTIFASLRPEKTDVWLEKGGHITGLTNPKLVAKIMDWFEK